MYGNLSYYQSKSINDLFMAIIVEEASDKESEEYMNSLIPGSEEYTKVKQLTDLISSKVAEANLKLGTECSINVSDVTKRAIDLLCEKFVAIVLLKDGDTYININIVEKIDMSTYQLKNLEPFSSYYKENEYRFEEADGRVILDVDSLEPFENFEKKYIQQNF